MIEEQHVSEYESLKDTKASWLEDLLLHEYTECYLYYSCMMTECDARIRQIWEDCLIQEISHLHKACELLGKYEHKDWQQVIPNGCLPEVLSLGTNIEYVRRVLETTVGNTQKGECVVGLNQLADHDHFFWYQNTINHDVANVASHRVIDQSIRCMGEDYRFETAPSPVCELRSPAAATTQPLGASNPKRRRLTAAAAQRKTTAAVI